MSCIQAFFDIFLEQIKTCIDDFGSLTLLQSEGGNKSLRLADNIDLVAGSIDKLTVLASRLTTNSDHLDFCVEVRLMIETKTVTTRKGKHVCLQEITVEERRWVRLTSFNILAPTDRMKGLQHYVVQETFSQCDKRTAIAVPILFPTENVRSEAALLC